DPASSGSCLSLQLHLETSSILLPSTPPSASWLPRGLSASCFLYVESRLCWLCLSTFYSPFINQLQCDFLVEEEEPTGYIRFEKFLPVMTEILLERRYRPIPEDILLRAFEVLDPSKRGFLLKEELIKYMTEEGEPFSQEEMEEMLSAAIDPESNSVHYKDYIAMMVIDES
uniref:EF-hand domain-containing protein n=1 Tax=Felis catus TaxID=9685 RepID=A0ABI7WLG0_FELCA